MQSFVTLPESAQMYIDRSQIMHKTAPPPEFQAGFLHDWNVRKNLPFSVSHIDKKLVLCYNIIVYQNCTAGNNPAADY